MICVRIYSSFVPTAAIASWQLMKWIHLSYHDAYTYVCIYICIYIYLYTSHVPILCIRKLISVRVCACIWSQLYLFLVRCACVLLWGVLKIGKRCCLECSIRGSLIPVLPWLVFFDMCAGVRLWMCKCMPCKWECTMPAWHVHVDRDRDRDMRWLRAALSHRYLYLDNNALTTLPPDVSDSLGNLL